MSNKEKYLPSVRLVKSPCFSSSARRTTSKLKQTN